MNHLLSPVNAADKTAVIQIDLERIDESQAFMRAPTRVDSVPNTIIGPPTTGTYPLHDLWVDQETGVFRCSVAGTPGTWVQVAPAVVAAFPVGTIPDGYLVERSDEGYQRYSYDLGTATWVAAGAAAPGALGEFVRVQNGGLQLWNPTISKWHTFYPTGPDGAVQGAWGPGET